MRARSALDVFRRLKEFVSRLRSGLLDRRTAFGEDVTEVIPLDELRHGDLIRGAELKVGDLLGVNEVVVNILYNTTNDHRFIIYKIDELYFKGYAEKIWITEYEDIYFRCWALCVSGFTGGLFADADLVEQNARREIDWLNDGLARAGE